MANAGTLAVSIIARTSKFKKGLRGVRRDLKTLNRQVFSTTSGIVALATGGGIGLLLKRQFELIDATAKTAQKLGIQNKQLIGLELNARRSGIGVNKLHLGLQRMTRRIAEASQGTGEAQGALKELNLDAVALAKLSPDQQFFRIADAMQNVKNQGDKVRLGFKLFDSEGVDLINTMRGGSRAIMDVMKDTEQFGTALNQLDARKVEIANDKLGDVRDVIKGVATQTAPLLSGIIIEISDRFVNAATEGENMGTKVNNMFKDIVEKSVPVVNTIKTIQLGFLSVGFSILKVGEGWALLTESIIKGSKSVHDITKFSPFGGITRFFKGFSDEQEAGINAVAEGFRSKSVEIFETMKQLSFEINNNTFNEDVNSFVNNANKRAETLARIKRNITNLEGENSAIKELAPIGEFRQIDLSRTVIDGTSFSKNVQKIESDQLTKLIQIEKQILNNIKRNGSGPAVAV